MSNIAASKMFTAGPFTLTAGIILFPVTYIVNDVLSEIYGFKAARFTILLGFAMNLLMVLYFTVTIMLPHPIFWQNQSAYATILGSTPRLFIASMAAYLVGSTLNAKVMVSMRDAAQHGRGLFLRCVLSTLCGEFADSVVFIVLAFAGTMPVSALGLMIITQALLKTLYEVIIFPVTNVVIKKIKAIETAKA
jgi:uncharacterized integral membrane protein (TIGR00697 family)